MKAVVPQGLVYNVGSMTNIKQGKVIEEKRKQSRELRKPKVLLVM